MDAMSRIKFVEDLDKINNELFCLPFRSHKTHVATEEQQMTAKSQMNSWNGEPKISPLGLKQLPEFATEKNMITIQALIVYDAEGRYAIYGRSPEHVTTFPFEDFKSEADILYGNAIEDSDKAPPGFPSYKLIEIKLPRPTIEIVDIKLS